MKPPRILVAGVGNIFLGDDAFGVEVVRHLAQRPQLAGVTVIDFGIRGLDLTYALQEEYEVVIMVDATSRGGRPGELYVLEVELEKRELADTAVEGHNLDPARVLALAAAMGSTIDRCLVVGCEPQPFSDYDDMTAGLSAPVQVAVSEAIALIEKLIGEIMFASADGDSVFNQEHCHVGTEDIGREDSPR